MKMGGGTVKHSLLGNGSKELGGSHLGELGCLFLVCCLFCLFMRKDRAWEEESKEDPGCPLKARLQVAPKPP